MAPDFSSRTDTGALRRSKVAALTSVSRQSVALVRCGTCRALRFEATESNENRLKVPGGLGFRDHEAVGLARVELTSI